MENASKALLMAGAMLIVLLITSLIVYMYQGIRVLPETEQEMREAEELEKFNKQYQAYERDGIRGTDVITLANKAITNNDQYEGLAEYQVTVNLNLRNDITAIDIHYEYRDDKVIETERYSSGAGSILAGNYTLTDKNIYNNPLRFGLILNPSTGATGNSDYYYITGRNGTRINDNKPDNWTDYWMRSDIGAEFKRKNFNCTVEEDNNTGRVDEINIEEQ